MSALEELSVESKQGSLSYGHREKSEHMLTVFINTTKKKRWSKIRTQNYNPNVLYARMLRI